MAVGETGAQPGGVVLMDKDGTLIEDLPYNVDPSRVRLAPGAADALRRLGAAGFGVAIVTNQSGVARGYFDEADLDALAGHLRSVLAGLGVPLLGFYACPHLPDGEVEAYAVECDCRKPAPGLIRRAVSDLGIDPAATWFIGDAWMDAAAGRAAGCRTIMVGPDAAAAEDLPPDRRPDHGVRDMAAAADIVLAEAGVMAGPVA